MFPFSSKGRARKAAGDRLYQASVTQARKPEIYRDLGVPDTPEGRFEMICLSMAVLIERLNREGPAGKDAAQEAFDAMFRDLDAALREMAVGDLSVSKKVKALASHFYACLTAYLPAIQAGDPAALAASLGAQDVLAGSADAEAIAARAIAWQATLGTVEAGRLLGGDTAGDAPGMRASA